MKNTETMINDLFTRMDNWRHLPSYQLERRSDLFFSLYLPEVLTEKLFTVRKELIPEFPIRIGTINENKLESNQSTKIDYFALSSDGYTAILIELKTDHASITNEQTRNLLSSSKKDFVDLLKGVIQIFKSGNLNSIRRRKYLYLLEQLDNLEQISMPPELKQIISNNTLHGITKASEGLKIISKVNKTIPVYIVPFKNIVTDNDIKIITFKDFQEIIERNNYNDLVSKCFYKSLSNWEDKQAGNPDK